MASLKKSLEKIEGDSSAVKRHIKRISEDIFVEIEEKEICRHSLSSIRLEIKNLEAQLEELPPPKTKPDQETLDLWNEIYSPEGERKEVQEKIKRKKELLDKLERANGNKVE